MSVFLSVDPLAEQFVGWTPYHYVHNNPINLIDPTGMSTEESDHWVEKQNGTIYWDEKATSKETTSVGEKYLGKNVLVATHDRSQGVNEPLNTAQFDLYLESNKEGPSVTIMGNTVPSDVDKSGTLAEGLYSAKFGHRNASRYQNELAIRIYNLDGSDGLPTVNGNPNPSSNGKTLTGVLFHMGNNSQTSLFDTSGNAYSAGCQTSGNFKGSRELHNKFMEVVGKTFKGNYYLRPNPNFVHPINVPLTSEFNGIK